MDDNKGIQLDPQTVVWFLGCLHASHEERLISMVKEAEENAGKRIHDEMRLSDDLSKKLNAANAELKQLEQALVNSKSCVDALTEDLKLRGVGEKLMENAFALVESRSAELKSIYDRLRKVVSEPLRGDLVDEVIRQLRAKRKRKQ